MNKEIKEILNYFIKYMTIDDCIRLNKVEDYITNLQEEVYNYRKLGFKHLSEQNKKIQEENERLKKRVQIGQNAYLSLSNKRDKAIEEINYMITNADITEISAIKLKQILGDKENE